MPCHRATGSTHLNESYYQDDWAHFGKLQFDDQDKVPQKKVAILQKVEKLLVQFIVNFAKTGSAFPKAPRISEIPRQRIFSGRR